MTRGPLKFDEIHPQTPTDERPDLKVGFRYFDSYALPFGRCTQGGVASYQISKVDSSDQHIHPQSSSFQYRRILAQRCLSFLCSGFRCGFFLGRKAYLSPFFKYFLVVVVERRVPDFEGVEREARVSLGYRSTNRIKRRRALSSSLGGRPLRILR